MTTICKKTGREAKESGQSRDCGKPKKHIENLKFITTICVVILKSYTNLL